MKKLVTPGNTIDYFMEKLKYAYDHNFIHKPTAWALYQTWKWADENEKWRE